MHIAIIGSGNIGGGLARAWRKKGHDVVIGARNPADPELQALAAETGVKIASVAEAGRAAPIVCLAMPWAATDDVIAQVGDWSGKTVIDTTNAVERGPGGMSLKFGHTTSSGEELQKKIPGAHVVRSFNAQGAENLVDPVYNGTRAANFFCGDDAKSRASVKQLIEDVGFEAIDVGPLRNARLLEPLMLLWIVSAGAMGSRDIAFQILRR